MPRARRSWRELERLGLLEKTEPHTHQVPHGDRGGVPVEPRLTTQWYCNAEVLAKPAIEAVETGKTVFVPKQWENTFFAWMRDIQPWCISRQLWWGHRIPAWYGPDGAVFVGYDEAEAKALARAHYQRDEVLTQDEDVLDTWFSSGLWPFSTLGWPEQTKELARYYPGDVLVTGFDIIFFWVARMMMQGIHFMGEVPFRTVYIHGLVRDERGQKMSKSKGNIIDPLELIDRYGADALRFTICALTGPGRDVKLGAARVESYRRFVTKLWNAARFCEMNGIAPDASFDPARATLPLTRWILDAMNRAIERGQQPRWRRSGSMNMPPRVTASPGTRSATGSSNSPSRCWRKGTARRRARCAGRRPMCLVPCCGCCIRRCRSSPRSCGIASATANRAA